MPNIKFASIVKKWLIDIGLENISLGLPILMLFFLSNQIYDLGRFAQLNAITSI